MNTTKKDIAAALKSEPRFIEVIAMFQNITQPNSASPTPHKVEYIAAELVGGLGLSSRFFFLTRRNFEPIKIQNEASRESAARRVSGAIVDLCEGKGTQ